MRIYRRILREISSFEWDPDKRESNLLKRGIDLVDAAGIFQRPVVEWEDNRLEYGERRMVAIGELEAAVLTVVYTVRGDVYRLISARRARHDEKAAYRQIRSEEAPEPDRLGPGPQVD
ncbi:MAG: BrnT family toxin [Gemmatimonadetes bacterium]|nr:BrnT family toxin [Gemmatimonadota bacterium]